VDARLVLATSLWLATSVLAGCDVAPADDPRPASWAPAPVRLDGLTAVADTDGDRFALHTASGDKRFLPGVNLGSTIPLHQPGELAIEAGDYRRWFTQMGDLGIRVVRTYTIHPPAFYDELAAYNQAHQAAPLYLVQGVYLPDESYVEDDGTLYDEAVDTAFSTELADASAAVHGELERVRQPGHAWGRWTADVSDWVVAWIVGVEWDPYGVQRTDEAHRRAPYEPGRFFVAARGATPTERWLARHLDELASAEAAHGVTVPIAFANWPTADPLAHPDEPNAMEDLVSVDANHVRPTDAWPAGTFASYHAYPYYPDFLRHEQTLYRAQHDGRSDPYAGYLQALREHHATMPVMVTEFGVPSSLGSAHQGPLGRDQGGHTEREAMEIDAELLRLIEAQGLSGGFVFAWTDEWFKRTWNTLEHQVPAERRQVWHDPLTNEQHFGMLATDSSLVVDSGRELARDSGALKYVLAQADAAYVHLDVTFRDELPEAVTLAADTVPGPETEDYRIELDLVGRTARAYVRSGLDPVRLDTDEEAYQPDAGEPWHLYRLLTNRALEVRGRAFPAEHQEVGVLVEGSWDPESGDYDSRATWQVDEEREPTLRLRVPWPMLGLGDPSSRTALGEGKPVVPVPVDEITLTFAVDGEQSTMDYTWPTWNHVGHTERLKDGVDALARAFEDLGR
jgi:hypothetical protein